MSDCVWAVAQGKPARGADYIVIVDGYNSGSLYAPALRKQGYRLVHVEAARTSPAFYWGMDRSLYDVHLNAGKHDVANIAHFLEPYRIRDVITGTDRGAPVADQLRFALGLPGNDPLFMEARHDKIEMGKIMGDVRQFASDDLDDLTNWARGHTYPLVMKVPQGVGTFGFHILFSGDDLKKAYRTLHGKPDNMGNPVTRVLLQEYLSGTVLAFDAISAGGHYVTEILRYTLKEIDLPDRGTSLLYDYADIVDHRDPVVAPLKAYGMKVLERSGMRYGASHIEIMDLGAGVKNRFRLIEINPRIVGAGIPDLVEASTGENPIDTHIASIRSPRAFLLRAGRNYARKKPARIVTLWSEVEGEIAHLQNIKALRSLPSYLDHRIKNRGRLVRTVDLATASGNVYLCHESQAQIDEDTLKIRKMNFFVLKPSGTGQ